MIQFTGLDALRKNIASLRMAYPQAADVAVWQDTVEHIFNPSQAIVPVDRGRLRASGVITGVRGLAGFGFVIVAYGTSYGLRIHQNTSLDAGREAAGKRGRSLFLKTPFDRARAGMLQRIARRTKDNVKRKVTRAATRTIKGTSSRSP